MLTENQIDYGVIPLAAVATVAVFIFFVWMLEKRSRTDAKTLPVTEEK